jgi:hypothetical protein
MHLFTLRVDDCGRDTVCTVARVSRIYVVDSPVHDRHM